MFGFIIALAGCFQGMLVEGNSEEVGSRTTTAVVQSIFLVIVLDSSSPSSSDHRMGMTTIPKKLDPVTIPEGCKPVIDVRHQRNSFGEQFIHEDLT